MTIKARLLGLLIVGTLLTFAVLHAAGQMTDSPLSPQELYGTFLINRTSEKNKVKPAVFSHWIHRRWHTCRICHFELGFKFKAGTTEITEEENRSGNFCGAPGCHDAKTEYGGKVVFGHTNKADCDKCHNGNINYGNERFAEIKKELPRDKYGNGINWVTAIEKGKINPMYILAKKPPPDLKMVKLLRFKGAWNVPLPPVAFSHKKHSKWLDCNNCHPELFPLPVEKEAKEGKEGEKDEKNLIDRESEKEPEKNAEVKNETKPDNGADTKTDVKPEKSAEGKSEKAAETKTEKAAAEPKSEKKPAKNAMKTLGEKNNMMAIFKGESCGLCHLRVAFPINDCPRCHPGLEGGY